MPPVSPVGPRPDRRFWGILVRLAHFALYLSDEGHASVMPQAHPLQPEPPAVSRPPWPFPSAPSSRPGVLAPACRMSG